MKIGIVCYPTHGGSGVVASELALGLAKRGHEIHIASYAQPFRIDSYQPNILFHEVGLASYPLLKYPPYGLALATKLVELAESYDLDILHAHYAVPHAASTYLTKQILGSNRVRTITTLHGTDITLVGSNQSYQRVIRFAIEQSDGVTAVSKHLQQRTVEEFDIKQDIRVIHNFIDVERTKPQKGLCCREQFAPQGEKLLIHASNFRPLKRVTDVVEVLHKVNQVIPAKLILVGDGPDCHKAKQLIRSYGLQDRVVFLGTQNHMEPILFCADLFLLPSEQESFGLAALEAMACEVPVLATQVGGLPEVVSHAHTGFLLPVGDTEAMAKKAIEILRDPAQHRMLKKQARDHAIARFDADTIIPQYEDFYEEVLRSDHDHVSPKG